jgi:glycosyl transferase, family 25
MHSAIIHFLNNYFDKIFVVSVPRFADRHKKVTENLQGLKFDFFWGADKLQLDLENAKQNGIYDDVKARQKQRQGKPLNIGEIACSLSHRMLYSEMIKHKWQRVLILEDDVLPQYDDLNKLPLVIKELPTNWELVYFGYLKHEKVTAGLKLKQVFYKIGAALGLMKWSYKMVNNLLPKPYSQHLKKAGFHDCTHAYAITLAAAQKLSAMQTPVVYRADDLLHTAIMNGELNAFITVPKFFDQTGFHDASIKSEIQ